MKTSCIGERRTLNKQLNGLLGLELSQSDRADVHPLISDLHSVQGQRHVPLRNHTGGVDTRVLPF